VADPANAGICHGDATFGSVRHDVEEKELEKGLPPFQGPCEHSEGERKHVSCDEG